MDFEQARTVVQAHLNRLYRDQREHPRVLQYGYDLGDAFAPLVNWDGVMGTYAYAVHKRSGRLTPLSFPQFEERNIRRRVGTWPADL